MPNKPGFLIEEWGDDHPRLSEMIECLKAAAPEQLQFLQGSYFQNFPCYRLVALRQNQVAGLLQFAVLPIGSEVNCPTLTLDGRTLTEAKIHAFAVHPDYRCQGMGKALQKHAIRLAHRLGCYQLASYSSYGREANFHVKLSLGFAVQPEVHGDNEKGVYFIMPLANLSPEDLP
ncbi:MAG: GNAT family N-acetyltransferase [Anaerolineaceae bacterium]